MIRPLEADRHGRGPAVLLLHGQPGSAADWVSVVPMLSDRFTVVVPDRPGYGRTGGPATGFAGNAGAAVDLLDRLALERAIVVGHSWGGGVALALAEAEPGRVAGLVLAASVGPDARIGWGDRLLAAPAVGEVMAAVTLGSLGAILARPRVQSAADHRLTGRRRRAIGTLTGLTGAGTGTPVWRSFVTEQRAYLREVRTLAAGLASLPHPTAVIAGSADRVVQARVGELLARAIPNATYTVVPGAHHRLPWEHPRAVANAVLEVWDRATERDGQGRPDRPGPSDGQEAPDGEGRADHADRGTHDQ